MSLADPWFKAATCGKPGVPNLCALCTEATILYVLSVAAAQECGDPQAVHRVLDQRIDFFIHLFQPWLGLWWSLWLVRWWMVET